MSKKPTNVDPISLLREYITGNKTIKHVDENLVFGSTKLPLSTPTAWNPKITGKQYNLGDLWLFVDSQLNADKYPGNKVFELQTKYSLQIVNKHDKDEIINYFTGKIEDSEAINQELKASIKVAKEKEKDKKNVKDKEKEKDKKDQSKKNESDPTVKKKVKTDEEGKEKDTELEIEKDEVTKNSDVFMKEKENLKIIDLIFKLERPIDSKNRTLRKLNKSFKSVLEYFTQEPRPETENRPSSTQQQSTQSTSSSKKGNMTRLDEILNMGTLGQSNPIILVLPVASPGSLSMENARDFLEKGIYNDPMKDKVEGQDKKKQTMIREMNNRKITFEIMADTSLIKKENLWPRVVAIFITGFTHQFQGWPDGDRVPILLSKKRAFHMKYHDIPIPDNVKKWNVKILEVNRNKRFLDATVKNQFWEELEFFIHQPSK